MNEQSGLSISNIGISPAPAARCEDVVTPALGSQRTLRALIVCPDRELGQYVHRVLVDDDVFVIRVIDRYPDQIEFTRMLRFYAPEAIFVGVEQTDLVVSLAAHVDQVMPGVQVVAVGRTADAQMLMDVMKAGVREFLRAPFHPDCLRDCLLRVKDGLARHPVDSQLSELPYSFLPAEPGVGAANAPDMNMPAMDVDLNCGMIRFMLKLNRIWTLLNMRRAWTKTLARES